MTTVNSKLPANLFVSATTSPLRVAEELKIDLTPGQLVRATVIESELGKVILEVHRQHYLAKGERELRVGQSLDLRVLQTQPQIEFKVIKAPLNDKLSQSLPLLSRSFDWSQLVGQLQQKLEQNPQSGPQVYRQLQQILDPSSGVPASLKADVALIVAQLQQLGSSGEASLGKLLPPTHAFSSPLLKNSQQFALSKTIAELTISLKNQLSLLPKEKSQPMPKNWYPETRHLLAPLQTVRTLPQFAAPQRQLLVAVLSQMKQHPRVSPQLTREVERILVQVEKQGGPEVFAPPTKGEVNHLRGDTSPVRLDLPASPSFTHSRSELLPQAQEREIPVSLGADIKQVLAQVELVQAKKQPLAPELLGRLEGLLERVRQLPQKTDGAPILIPNLEQIVGQLEQLVSQRPIVPQGGQLGLLSQLFGFHLEAELLQGKKKVVLESLKASLLGLQKDMGDDVAEPLRRLELFQLCKAKFAEEQIQFLPLPFNELEDGYLLAERQSQTEDENTEAPYQMSLSLRLSALGNLRVDMLYEEGGLHLRLACQDREKMTYVQGCADELKEGLNAVALKGISFSRDAQLPAKQLQERLQPDSSNMLDARI